MARELTEVQQKLFEVVDTMVVEYVKDNEVSPFRDIQQTEGEGDTISLSIDMDKDFEDKLQNKLKDKTNEALEVYFSRILELMAEDLEQNPEKYEQKDEEDEKGLTKE
jgi:hypothetical protein